MYRVSTSPAKILRSRRHDRRPSAYGTRATLAPIAEWGKTLRAHPVRPQRLVQGVDLRNSTQGKHTSFPSCARSVVRERMRVRMSMSMSSAAHRHVKRWSTIRRCALLPHIPLRARLSIRERTLCTGTMPYAWLRRPAKREPAPSETIQHPSSRSSALQLAYIVIRTQVRLGRLHALTRGKAKGKENRSPSDPRSAHRPSRSPSHPSLEPSARCRTRRPKRRRTLACGRGRAASCARCL
jgi:hypothetical protein